MEFKQKLDHLLRLKNTLCVGERLMEKEIDPLGKFCDLETLIKGLFEKKTIINYIRHFTLFVEQKTTIKMIANYHQYHAVQFALERIVSHLQKMVIKKVVLFGTRKGQAKVTKWRILQVE